MKRASLAMLIILVMLILTACGRNRGEPESDEGNDTAAPVGIAHPGNVQTLSLSVPLGNANANFSNAAENLRRIKQEQSIDLQVHITTYTLEERDDHFTLMLSQLAAGLGPDVFAVDGFQLHDFWANDLLMNIYVLMNNSSEWSLDDFFTNALRAYEIDRRLFVLPLSFGFDMVGINANVPPAFISRFAALPHASFSEITALYLDLIIEHPEWSEFALIRGMTAAGAFAPEINAAVDFSQQRVSFPSSAVNLLANIRQAFEGNHRFDTAIHHQPTEEVMTLLQERYVFYMPMGTSATSEAFFNFQQPFFVHYLPLADDNGHLVDSSWGTTQVAVNANANPELAWAFIGQLLSVTGTGGGNFQGNSHIVRRYA